MESFVVRVWMPDRPGALGQVASRIGAVRGDVVGIDILERGAGRAIDELVVQLPDASLLPLLLSEISAVDGVDVEDVRPAAESLRDPRLAALETAAMLVGASSVADLLSLLVQHAMHDFNAEWAAIVDLDEPSIKSGAGPVPPAAWLEAFVEGSRSSARVAAHETGPADVAWAPLPSARLSLVLGRSGRPLRGRERRQVAALARIADTRWTEVVVRDSQARHPSSLA
ncbi:MAG: hypothetical protein JWN67_2551 [Actinomycetia bacterium]|nr:hypothetical protein [Actinomycetes bacterium]